MQEIFWTILQSVQTALQNLGLSGIQNSQIVVRMLPKNREQVDTLPMIAVAPGAEPEIVEQASFEGLVNVVYPVEIMIIAASDQNFTTNLETYLLWREKIRRAFQAPPLTGATTVWKVEMEPDPVFNRSLLNQQYAYSGVRVLFTSCEQRGN